MIRSSCDRAQLVEAMFDGRLGPNEEASIERHLKTCAPCAELLQSLRATQRALQASVRPLTPLEHQRARMALLREGATAAPSPKKRWPVALLVAAALTLPLGVWAATSSFSFLHGKGAPTAPPAPSASARAHAAPSPPARIASLEPLPTSQVVVPAPAIPTASLEHRRHDAAAPKTASSSVPADTSPASRDFAAAMQAVSRGDFSAGASQLEAFAATYPRDERAPDSVYLQAIALERAGRVADARAVARRYLDRYPGAAHTAQARRIAGD
jgi:TolA-binding protein